MNESMEVEQGQVALLNKSEIDMQIATAHKYPRNVTAFRNSVQQMATLTQEIAAECMYSVPREGKNIVGPSARFAEIVASSWGNCRAGARVIADQGEFIVAQGVFHDLERNVAITYEVQRRITNRRGDRFSPDMIAVTANAACSIALRNAVFKGVPKAYWSEMYEAARECAIGNSATLADRRARALEKLQKFGVQSVLVFTFLGIQSAADITLDHLEILFGIMTRIKDGEIQPDEAFGTPIAFSGTDRSAIKDPQPLKTKVETKPEPTSLQKFDSEKPLASTPQATHVAASTEAPTLSGGQIKALHSKAAARKMSMSEFFSCAGCTYKDDQSVTLEHFDAVRLWDLEN